LEPSVFVWAEIPKNATGAKANITSRPPHPWAPKLIFLMACPRPPHPRGPADRTSLNKLQLVEVFFFLFLFHLVFLQSPIGEKKPRHHKKNGNGGPPSMGSRSFPPRRATANIKLVVSPPAINKKHHPGKNPPKAPALPRINSRPPPPPPPDGQPPQAFRSRLKLMPSPGWGPGGIGWPPPP